MDNITTYSHGALCFYTSNMILNAKSYITYLFFPKTWSQLEEWFIFGNDPSKSTKTMTNASIHVMCNTIKNVI